MSNKRRCAYRTVISEKLCPIRHLIKKSRMFWRSTISEQSLLIALKSDRRLDYWAVRNIANTMLWICFISDHWIESPTGWPVVNCTVFLFAHTEYNKAVRFIHMGLIITRWNIPWCCIWRWRWRRCYIGSRFCMTVFWHGNLAIRSFENSVLHVSWLSHNVINIYGQDIITNHMEHSGLLYNALWHYTTHSTMMINPGYKIYLKLRILTPEAGISGRNK